MSKSKIDFLADILSQKKLEPKLKKKLLYLASMELKKLKVIDQNMEEKNLTTEFLNQKISNGPELLDLIFIKDLDSAMKEFKI